MSSKQVKVSVTLPLEFEGELQTFVASMVKAMRKKDKTAKVHYSAVEVEEAAVVERAARTRTAIRGTSVMPMRARAASAGEGRRMTMSQVQMTPAQGAPRNSVVYRTTRTGSRAMFNGVRGIIVTYLTQHPNSSARDIMEDCYAALGYPSPEAARKSVESGLHNLRSQSPAIVESVQA